MMAAFVVNSCRANPAAIERLVKKSLPDWEVSVYTTAISKSAVQPTIEALATTPDVIVGVGGDGTLNQIAQLTVPANVPLGILPTGRANDLARSLGIPLDLRLACQRLATARRRSIDVLDINGRFVLTAGGIGLPSWVVNSAHGSRASSYIFSALAGLMKKAAVLRGVSLESLEHVEKCDVLSLTFHNQGTMGRFFRLAPGANCADSLMDVCLIRAMPSRISAFAVLLRVLRGKHVGSRFVNVFRTGGVSLSCALPFKYMGDGEILGDASKISVAVRPSALALLY